jgi:hypothetical protein
MKSTPAGAVAAAVAAGSFAAPGVAPDAALVADPCAPPVAVPDAFADPAAVGRAGSAAAGGVACVVPGSDAGVGGPLPWQAGASNAPRTESDTAAREAGRER